MNCVTLAPIGAALLLLSCSLARGDLLMVYSINRHGARNALAKSSTLKESASIGGVTLLPQGQRLCYNAGAEFGLRYLSPTCNSTGTCLAQGGDTTYGPINGGHGFNNFNTWVRSSYTDRALLSAHSWLAGVFPAQEKPDPSAKEGLPTGVQLVPVYTEYGRDEDDWLVRAYTKCPVYDAQLETWYASSEFKTKESDSAALRQRVAQINTGLNTSLANWWNVFDAWNVYRTYGVGTPMPIVDNDLFSQIQSLAVWLELAKGRSSLKAGLAGNPLVSDMISYMSAAVAARNQASVAYYRLLTISGHYNVQLAVLAALGLDTYARAQAVLPWLTGDSLPQLASQLVFELHGPAGSGVAASAGGGGTAAQGLSDDTTAVRLVVQDGPNAISWLTVPLPCESDAGAAIAGRGACTLAAFNRACTSCMEHNDAWDHRAPNTKEGAVLDVQVGSSMYFHSDMDNLPCQTNILQHLIPANGDRLKAAAAVASGGNATAWCASCGNTNALSCQLVAAMATAATSGDGSGGGRDQVKRLRIGVGVGVALTFLTGILLTVILMQVLQRRRATWSAGDAYGGIPMQPTTSTGKTPYHPPAGQGGAPSSVMITTHQEARI